MLKRAYSQVFTNLDQFIIDNFPIDKCLGLLFKKEVIDKECRRKIVNKTLRQEQTQVLITYLRDENNIKKFDNFLIVCRTFEQDLAQLISDELQKEKVKVGLLP